MIRVKDIFEQIEKLGIEVIAGVPDSTLKHFCDGLQTYSRRFRHCVTANEGAAVGIAIGTYLASGKPACIYMQNSGIGNVVNPIASLAHRDVYGIPMLFIVGWRGEPGTKDEPQHVFQGKATCQMFDTLEIPYAVIGAQTTEAELENIWGQCTAAFGERKQFAIIVKKGTFTSETKYVWNNGNTLNRESVLRNILETAPRDGIIVSTTGKISRELYEQCCSLYGNHDALFMTVGGMGHASMIAYGIAINKPDRQVICIDGDGAALMHMGAMAFIASQAPENFIHIVINNMAHESVGAMPTGCQNINFAMLAKAAGYVEAQRITNEADLEDMQGKLRQAGPVLYEIMVSLDSREDLGRPKETARENAVNFIRFLEQ